MGFSPLYQTVRSRTALIAIVGGVGRGSRGQIGDLVLCLLLPPTPSSTSSPWKGSMEYSLKNTVLHSAPLPFDLAL